MLEIRNVSLNFGGLQALSNLSFNVTKGEVFGLIGPNGAGKSTLFNAITGFYRISSGDIFYEGEPISNLKPFQIASKGIVRTFQHNIIFPELTVMENTLLGCHLKSQVTRGLFSLKRIPHSEIVFAEGILEYVGLIKYKDEYASNLPHGFQQMLKIAIALGSDPKVLLLDEPVSGMNQEEMTQMEYLIGNLFLNKGITVIIVEHNMRTVMCLCCRIVVIDAGKKIAEGSADEIRRNRDVIEAYLGKDNARS